MKVKIIANPRKPWAKELAKEVAAFLKPVHTIVKRGADATICIGGDGTILYASHKGRIGGAVLGIGGPQSYICQTTRSSWKNHILKILNTGKTIEAMALTASIGSEHFTALNDFVIHATHYRVAELDVSYGPGKASFQGDGVIISSALGSPAYAYSAGADKFGPTERKLIVVPICPYRRAFSPQVLGEDAAVEVRVGSDCAFIADGIFVRKLDAGEIVRIAKGRNIIFFEGVGSDDFKG